MANECVTSIDGDGLRNFDRHVYVMSERVSFERVFVLREEIT